MSKDPNDKPLVNFNEQGFVLNYSVTRNEEIAFVNYQDNTVTFKQMPIPIERINEMLEYFNNTRNDHEKFVKGQTKETTNESSNSKSSK